MVKFLLHELYLSFLNVGKKCILWRSSRHANDYYFPCYYCWSFAFSSSQVTIRFYKRRGVRLHCGTINTDFLSLRPRLWQAEFLAANHRKTLADLGKNGVYWKDGWEYRESMARRLKAKGQKILTLTTHWLSNSCFEPRFQRLRQPTF